MTCKEKNIGRFTLVVLSNNIAHTSFNEIKRACESIIPGNVANFLLAQLRNHYKSVIFNNPQQELLEKTITKKI